MNNLLEFQPGTSLIHDVLWQSGLFLSVGQVVSFGLRGRPARAHRVLVLAMAGVLVTPAFSQLVRCTGWGFLTTSVPHSSPVPAISTAAIETVQPTRTAAVRRAASPAEPVPTRAIRVGAERLSSTDQPILPSSTRDALVGLWCVLSGLGLARLVVSLALGHRIVGRARPIACESTDRALDVACTWLGLRGARPVLCSSPRVACPAIWCWGLRPVIVVPHAVDVMSAPVDWVGVFCHELGHWLRRDQWSSLAGELLVCALPWHPLAWFTRHRLGQLSELACDDWALASGQEPTAYAETLLELVPRRAMTSALAAVSRRNGLASRVARILATEGPVEPRPGGRFSRVVALAAIAIVSLMALAQPREGGAQSDAMRKIAGQAKPVAEAKPASGNQANHRVIRGSVRDTSGRPIAGASVFAVGWPQDLHEYPRERSVAEGYSDRDGRFSLNFRTDPSVGSVDIIARAAGKGIVAHQFSILPDEQGRMLSVPLRDRPVELTLPPTVPIQGRLLSPSGMPVSGATVALAVLSFGERPLNDEFALLGPEDDAGRPRQATFWPSPVITDSQGQFQLDGLFDKAWANITIEHDNYVYERLSISTESEPSGWRKQTKIKPIAPRFTHVLEPARPIEGVVTDHDTGRPIGGVKIEVADIHSPESRFRFPTTTDNEGRYRIVGVAWNQPKFLYVNVIPGATTGYLPTQKNREEWPVGVKELRWNFTLKKGRFAQGRVVNADARRPIEGARVRAEGHSNPNPAVTDAQGKFALCMDPYYHSLFVEGPTNDYQRVTVPRGEVQSQEHSFFPHGYARVEIPPKGELAPLEIVLNKGATIAAQAVDPDAKPVHDIDIAGRSVFAELDYNGVAARGFTEGLFRRSCFVPGQNYRLFFMQDERHLAGFADLTARVEPTVPVPVTLRPTATVRGKLLKSDGTPDRWNRVRPYVLMTPDEVKLVPMEFLVEDHLLTPLNFGSRFDGGKTNDNGEFEVVNLMAGVKVYLATSVSSAEVEYTPIDPLRPGEVRDIGAVKFLVLKEKQP